VLFIPQCIHRLHAGGTAAGNVGGQLYTNDRKHPSCDRHRALKGQIILDETGGEALARKRRTPELGIEQARALFRSIDVSNVVGLRDRAVLGVLAYAGTRVNAVAKLHLSGYRNLGEQRALRFREKGGKDREIPVRHDLQGLINEYIAAAGIAEDTRSAPLFRAAEGTRKQLARHDYKAHSIRQSLLENLPLRRKQIANFNHADYVNYPIGC
jgi:integrase